MPVQDSIAIVGIGCHFPGGIETPERFWELLRKGEEAITEVPPDRWNLESHYNPDPRNPLTQHVRRGGFLEKIDQFDPGFFGITPREALCMDPQQRLLLEVAWRSIEDAGQPVDSLRGRPIGVFVGISSADYSSLLWTSSEDYATPDNEPFILPGNTGCIAANRLSYFLDLKGPSFTVDTACSSSLVAVHLACESLWRGESELAFAGGVQALIHPGIQMSFCKAGLLSPDGRCKSFDAEANGYVRSEGAGVILLKPLSSALKDGDQIHALIRGTAVNSDGRSQGLAAPSQRSQMACVREAYGRAGIDPESTQYVEAHGTGTRQGDPIELRALGTVLGAGRPEDQPCRVGSVKTNLGHGETAAGITGLIKAALSIRERQLPPSLHFHNPNPSIDFKGLGLEVQTKLEPFPQPSTPLIVGVSSFGFGGTNAHAVLSEAPQAASGGPGGSAQEPPINLCALSARTPAALDLLIAAYSKFMKQEDPQLKLNDLCASTNLGRSMFPHRFIAIASNREELLAQLDGHKKPAWRGEASLAAMGNHPIAAELIGLQLGVDGLEGRKQLEALAIAIGKGHKIDWQQFHCSYPYQKISIPGHPFIRQSYWWNRIGEGSTKASLWLDHLGKNDGKKDVTTESGLLKLQSICLPGSTEHFNACLDPTHYKDLKDHVVRNWKVFPAAGYLELALDLKKERKEEISLKDFLLETPLKMGESPLPFQALLEGDVLTFYSYDSPKKNWRRHGEVLFNPLQSGRIGSGLHQKITAPSEEATQIEITSFYKTLDLLGLSYGYFYRTINKLNATAREAWSELERPEGAPDRCLIDGCFQTVAACTELSLTNGQLLLPVGVENIYLKRWPLPSKISCHTSLRSLGEGGMIVADLTIASNEGVCGQITGLKLRRLTRSVLELLFPPNNLSTDRPGLFKTIWVRTTKSHTEASPDSGIEIFLLNKKHSKQTGFYNWAITHNHSIKLVQSHSELPTGTDPLVIWPENSRDHPIDEVKKLMSCCQNLVTMQARPLWLVIEGESPTSNALAAFQRTLALEHTEFPITTVYLPEGVEEQPNQEGWDEIWEAAKEHSELKWLNGELLSPELTPLEDERFRILSDGTGRIEGLHQKPLPSSRLLPGEIELAVEATGLNFRDVLNALGLLKDHAKSLGLEDQSLMPFGGEAVGRVVAVGPNVDPKLLGKQLIASLTVGSLASHVIARAELCVPLPKGMSVEEGASFSTAFLTAVYGLETLANLQPGETVLIHAAAGGVGQAAVQIAKRAGAKIIATASANKQSTLLEQGVDAVFDSRTLDFADQVLTHTNGKGVDVVLNSLKGDWVDSSFTALSKGGRFIELGKIEIWSKEKARQRRPDASYLPFDLLEVAATNPSKLRHLLQKLVKDLGDGSLKHIPQQTWSLKKCEDAFRHMAQARHIGKVVITQGNSHKPLNIRSNATYLVSGALGGIGLELLPWLAKQGCSSFILISRSVESPNEKAKKVLADLEKEGVRFTRIACDLSKPDSQAKEVASLINQSLKTLPKNKPLKGIFHAAGILQDAMVSKIDASSLEEVMSTKVNGWHHFEKILKTSPGIEFLIGFSSIAALLGSPGQAAYAAANGAIEGYCSQSEDKTKRIAIQWGPWNGGGMAIGLERRFDGVGIRMLNPEDALNALERVLSRGLSEVVAVLDNDWQKLASQALPRQQSWFSELLESVGPSPAERLWEHLQTLPETKREYALMEALRERLAKVMAAEESEGSIEPSSIDSTASLFNLGLDSLMAVEYAAVVQSELGIRLDLEALTDDPSLDGLASISLKQLMPQGEASPNEGLNLAEEAKLSKEWECPSSSAITAPGKSILLTGASGFLGAYLLAGQLERWPDLQIRCLVRASSKEEGKQRIQTNLKSYGLWSSTWEERLEPILGDLSRPSFGLDDDCFDGLSKSIGGILHNGAQLSQMASYAQLAGTNVGGTKEILRLATVANPIRVELISSVAVFEAAAYRNHEVLETDDISEWEGIHIGYSQTKWVTEQLILAAGKEGLPVAVYRPPLIGGHSKTGQWHDGDLLQRLLQGCLALGKAPKLAWELDLVPVDYVADAVSALAWSPQSVGKCFHLQHPRPLMLNDLLSQLITDGAPLEQVSMDDWLNEISRDPSNPLHPLRAFFQQRWGPEQLTYPELNALGVRARPSCIETLKALEALSVSCPNFAEMMGPWAGSLLSSSLATSK